MIDKTVEGDILASDCQHIVFAINVEGWNTGGFAGQVVDRYWPELAGLEPEGLGKVYSKQAEGRTFHACTVYLLFDDHGWAAADRYLEECLSKLDIPSDETVGIVQIGGGNVGQSQGADQEAIEAAMQRSSHKLALYIYVPRTN